MGGGIQDVISSNQHLESRPNLDDSDLDGGIHFMSKFRERYGAGVTLPDFEPGSWDDQVKRCREENLPMFLYLQDDQGDECAIVDQTVIGDPILPPILNGKFVPFALNVRSKDGDKAKNIIGVKKVPWIGVLFFKNSTLPQ